MPVDDERLAVIVGQTPSLAAIAQMMHAEPQGTVIRPIDHQIEGAGQRYLGRPKPSRCRVPGLDRKAELARRRIRQRGEFNK